MFGRSTFQGVRRWLTVAEAAGKRDAIFVLAGARERKEYGLELYRQGLAPRIVLSVARFEIWKFKEVALPLPPGSEPPDLLAAREAIPPPQRHFFVELDRGGVRFEKMRTGRFGTLAEITALAEWCERNREVRSLLVVSSAYHLRRVRMCCRALLAKDIDVTYVAAPGKPPRKLAALEWVKLAAYWVVLSGATKR